ncbi:MAG TPA: hypothetical protein VIT23_11445 [Terrimicrobiaceae bacterium]
MRAIDHNTITDAAIEQMSGTPDPRLKQIMVALSTGMPRASIASVITGPKASLVFTLSPRLFPGGACLIGAHGYEAHGGSRRYDFQLTPMPRRRTFF